MRLTMLVIVLIAGTAHAYPQFQLSQGAERCSACHLSPAGGGLLNAYGRNEAGETLSRGGDGRFLYGAWEPPAWLQLGADVRGAAGLKYQAGDREVLAFLAGGAAAPGQRLIGCG